MMWPFSARTTRPRSSVRSLRSHVRPRLEALEDRNLPSGWVATATGGSAFPLAAVAYDSAGDTYLAGNFGSSITLGSITLKGSGFPEFVAKLDPAGNWLWAKKLGYNNTAAGPVGLAVDSSGNVYAAGSFAGKVAFGSTILTDTGQYADGYVSKLDTNGNFQWAVQMGGSGQTHATSLALDGSGNVYVAGWFDNTANFGTIQLPHSGAFLTKISQGTGTPTFAWALGQDSAAGQYGESVVADAAGTVYFESLSAVNPQQVVSSYDTNGNLLWSQVINEVVGGGIGESLALYTDPTGHDFVYASGVGVAGIDKLDGSTGNVVWTTTFASPASDFGQGVGDGISSLATDSNGNVYATGGLGSCSLPVNFDPGTGTADFYAPRFLVKLDPNGNFLDARMVGGSGVAVDPSGNIHSVGRVSSAGDAFDTGDQDVTVTPTGWSLVVALTTQDQGGVMGRVFNDLNNNGTLDPNENGVSPVTVYADLNNNGQLDPGEPSTTVATSFQAGNPPGFFGEYYLDHLAPGTYTIREVLPAGWSQTSPAGNNGITVTVTAGQAVDTQNFGAFFPNQTTTYASTNVPITIPAAPRSGGKTVTSTLTIGDAYPIFSLQASVTVTGATGASFGLISPGGTAYVVSPGTTTLPAAPLFESNINGTWTLKITTNPGSASGTLTAWSLTVIGAEVPNIGSFAANPNPVSTGKMLTLSAGSVQDLYPSGGGITSVAFYQGATFLGYGTNNNGTYSLAVTAPATAGTYTYSAVAQDAVGVQSVPATVSVTVKSSTRSAVAASSSRNTAAVDSLFAGLGGLSSGTPGKGDALDGIG